MPENDNKNIKTGLTKEKLLNKVIPNDLKQYLFKGLYVFVGDTIYKATAKAIISRDDKRQYFLDFQTVDKNTFKDIFGKEAMRELIVNYSCDYDEPIPCNVKNDYKFIVDDIAWNTYGYPVWDAKEVKDNKDLEEKCPTTLKLFKHIYGDKLILGLDYMTVEFNLPIHSLPIQVLFSVENNTGKTTILNHRNWIYGKNAVIIDSSTFDDKFNGMIVGKNFIGIDEGKLKDEHAMEKIKMRVTAPKIPYRAMRKTAIEVKNFGKYFITTNTPNFAKISKEDSRFWVIKVPPLDNKNFDKNFETKLKDEIPYWIGFLKQRWAMRGEDVSKDKSLFEMETPIAMSRLWFSLEQYQTDALKQVILNSFTFAAKTFLDDIIEFFDHMNGAPDKITESDKVYEIFATVKMIKDKFYEKDSRLNTAVIKNVLEKEFGIFYEKNNDGTIRNYYFKTYLEHVDYEGNCINVKNIRRRKVYRLNYFDLVALRDGEDIRNRKVEYESEKENVQKEVVITEGKVPF